MWAQQDRFADLAVFRAAVAAMGYDAIEVSHSTAQTGLETLLVLRGKDEIGVSSLHAPTPRRTLPDGRNNSNANLASPDEAQRREAINEHKRTIDYAAAHAIPFVVVHLGGVGDTMHDYELELRHRFDAGERDGEQVDHLRDHLIRWRAANRGPYLEAGARSLRELVDYAAPHNIALGLENRYHYHEIPHPDEAQSVLAPYSNAQAGYWHDTGHAEVQARMRLIDRYAWFPALTPRTIGSHLHDVLGIGDHRAPGAGDVDWAYIAAGLPPTALRVFEIDQRQPDEAVAASIAFLREKGVVS